MRAAAQDQVGSAWNCSTSGLAARRSVKPGMSAGRIIRPSVRPGRRPEPARRAPASGTCPALRPAPGRCCSGKPRKRRLPGGRIGGQGHGDGAAGGKRDRRDCGAASAAVDRLQQLVGPAHPGGGPGGKDQDVDGRDACGRACHPGRMDCQAQASAAHPAAVASQSGARCTRGRAAFAQDFDLAVQPVLHPVGGQEALATDLPVQWLKPPEVQKPTTAPSSQIGSHATTSASLASTMKLTSLRFGPGGLFGGGGGLADPVGVLVPADEAVKAGFGRGVVRAELAPPGAEPLVQPQRHHRPHPEGAQAKVLARLRSACPTGGGPTCGR